MSSGALRRDARSGAFAPSVSDWRQVLAQGRAALKAEFAVKPEAAKVLQRQCALVDDALRAIWSETGQSDELALVAVGGYGRGLLYPYSDVDVLILVPDEFEDASRARVEALVGVLWDIGLEIGHSVRSISECQEEARRDLTVQTTLLESRLVAGNRKQYARFAGAKLLEQQQRHTRFNDTAYNLEPNIKESPGGLRDLQNILWISRAAGLGHSWQDLTRQKILTREETRQLQRHEATLAVLRVRLHYLTSRREDRLLFDFQSALAKEYGLAD